MTQEEKELAARLGIYSHTPLTPHDGNGSTLILVIRKIVELEDRLIALETKHKGQHGR